MDCYPAKMYLEYGHIKYNIYCMYNASIIIRYRGLLVLHPHLQLSYDKCHSVRQIIKILSLTLVIRPPVTFPNVSHPKFL